MYIKDIKDTFTLPVFSFYLYLQLRHAIRALGVSLQHPLSSHPLFDMFTVQRCNKGLVFPCAVPNINCGLPLAIGLSC